MRVARSAEPDIGLRVLLLGIDLRQRFARAFLGDVDLHAGGPGIHRCDHVAPVRLDRTQHVDLLCVRGEGNACGERSHQKFLVHGFKGKGSCPFCTAGAYAGGSRGASVQIPFRTDSFNRMPHKPLTDQRFQLSFPSFLFALVGRAHRALLFELLADMAHGSIRMREHFAAAILHCNKLPEIPCCTSFTKPSAP